MTTAPENSQKIRSVSNVVNASRQLEGAGFVVNRPFPNQEMALVDPFLLLDEMGPMELGPGEAKGAPDHPHRGFETVTYMISGKMEHRDSHGNASVRVVAGESMGKKAVIDTRTPIIYLHFTLKPGARVIQPVPAEYNAFAYVFGGEGRLGREERTAREHQMVTFAGDGDAISIAAPESAREPLEVLLIAGKPLRAPVARYGPFVMNTKEEIVKAFEDYREGRMGEIAPA